ncbi:8162_t:CDS:2, partial [Scutellospora calospora]
FSSKWKCPSEHFDWYDVTFWFVLLITLYYEILLGMETDIYIVWSRNDDTSDNKIIGHSLIAILYKCTFRAGPNSNKRRKSCRHVLLISIDGLHQKDVDVFTSANPKSTLAKILKHSVYFKNAKDALPTDSFPGLLAQLTGGHPKTTGVWYDNS